MSEYVYSANENAFFPNSLRDSYEQAGTWPFDGLEVSIEIAGEFMGNPPPGKQRAAGANGMPCWEDIPPPTPEQTKAAAIAKATALRKEADSVIAPLKDALDGGYIDEKDKPWLMEWQKYRYALTKIDPSTIQADEWPKAPVESAT